MNLQWIGCASGNFRRGRPAPHKPEAIVVHIICGSLASADSHFNNPASQVSAHYGIGKDGTIHQYVDELDTAFHAGIVVNPQWKLIDEKKHVNPNFYTLGIEHAGQPEDVWPDAQVKASASLIADVAARWDIPLDTDHVVRHQQIRASKTCPGSYIQIPILLEQARSSPVPTGVETGKMTVHTVTPLNLRGGRPSTAARVVRVLPKDIPVDIVRSVTGAVVNGNPYWYEDVTGNYLWSGGTDRPFPMAAESASRPTAEVGVG